MRKRSAGMGVATVFLVTLGAPGVAQAAYYLTSYQGADYSRDSNSAQQVLACDRESDNHGVHADFRTVGSGVIQQIRDGDGNNGVCAVTGVYSQKIYSHRAVEEIPRNDDNFGPWVYPS